MQRNLLAITALVCAFSVLASSYGATVRELTRISGQGEYILRGAGLVVGLPGTGDSGKELQVARPLAAALANEGNQLGNLKELAASKSVALVAVTCVIKEGAGARADDRIDVEVHTFGGSATSLKGGHLYLAPLRGPLPDSPVFAIAEGPVEVEGAAAPTNGRVRLGARMIREVKPQPPGDVFELIIDPPFAGYTAAREIASAINASAQPQGPGVATVVDDRVVRIEVPKWERADRAGFIAAVLESEVNMRLLGIPAQVICNTRAGSIIVTSDVEISPVAISHKDLNITTTIPPTAGTPQNPIVERTTWAGVKTAAKPGENAKLADLLSAFKHLDIPVSEQIGILQQLHKSGKLHAKLVVD